MIDGVFFRRLYIGSSILCALLVGGALALWNSAPIAGGLAAGCAIGLFPFVTWQIVARLLGSRRGRIAAALLTVLKYGAVAAALYFLVTRGWVHPWALLAGMLAVSTVFLVLGIARVSASPTGGTA